MATPKEHLRSIVNEDGAAILDSDRGIISTLNVTGGYIWEALSRGENQASIVKRLAGEFGEPPEIVERDVRDFLMALEQQKLLSR